QNISLALCTHPSEESSLKRWEANAVDEPHIEIANGGYHYFIKCHHGFDHHCKNQSIQEISLGVGTKIFRSGLIRSGNTLGFSIRTIVVIPSPVLFTHSTFFDHLMQIPAHNDMREGSCN